MLQSSPSISVVIPCRNGARTLRAQIQALLEQETTAQFEIVVADNGSTDGTQALVAEMSVQDARVRLADASRSAGINTARNDGIRASRGDVVLLCDADDKVHAGWIEAYVAAFEGGATCAGGGHIALLPDGTVLECSRGLRSDDHNGVPYPIGANCGFRRTVFDQLGGFDEELGGGGDEIDFFWRAATHGYETTYVPGALIDYAARASAAETFRQYRNYGRGRVALNTKHGYAAPEVMTLRSGASLIVGLANLIISKPGDPRRYRGARAIGWRAGVLLAKLDQRRARRMPRTFDGNPHTDS